MYVSEPDFAAGVGGLVDLMEKEHVRVLVNGAPFGAPIRFEFDPAADTLALFRANGAPTSFLFDVTEVLSAILWGETAEGLVRFRSDPDRWKGGGEEENESASEEESDEEQKPEDAELTTWKYDLVKSAFPIDLLHRRLWAKTTAKYTLFGSAVWELVRKLADSDADPSFEGGQIVGTLKLSGHDPDRFYSDDRPRFSVVVDAEDVGYLIDTLTRFRAAMISEQVASAND